MLEMTQTVSSEGQTCPQVVKDQGPLLFWALCGLPREAALPRFPDGGVHPCWAKGNEVWVYIGTQATQALGNDWSQGKSNHCFPGIHLPYLTQCLGLRKAPSRLGRPELPGSVPRSSLGMPVYPLEGKTSLRLQDQCHKGISRHPVGYVASGILGAGSVVLLSQWILTKQFFF